jgi:hypothetical protein
MNYLVIEGFKDAAEQFALESGTTRILTFACVWIIEFAVHDDTDKILFLTAMTMQLVLNFHLSQTEWQYEQQCSQVRCFSP